VANVLAALEKAPDPVFQRWLEGRKNMWALKQIEWKEDASDLMEEVESFYLNLREERSWKKPHDDRARAYTLKASDASVSSDSTQDMESSISKKQSSTLNKYVKAFAATEKQLREQKYKWKQVPPKDGESTTKKVLVDGVRKKYYWCVHHKAQTNMKAHQRGRGHMIRQGLLLKQWPCLPKAIQPHPAAVPTVLSTQIRTAISQELPTV
jgi:hypothetical protein